MVIGIYGFPNMCSEYDVIVWMFSVRVLMLEVVLRKPRPTDCQYGTSDPIDESHTCD